MNTNEICEKCGMLIFDSEDVHVCSICGETIGGCCIGEESKDEVVCGECAIMY